MRDEARAGRGAIWAARGGGILLAVFLAAFSFDIFGEDYGFWEAILALFVHLIPAFVVLLVLWISWRRPGVGAAAFPLLGAAYFVGIHGWNGLPGALVLTLPPMLIGGLFLLGWRLATADRAARSDATGMGRRAGR